MKGAESLLDKQLLCQDCQLPFACIASKQAFYSGKGFGMLAA